MALSRKKAKSGKRTAARKKTSSAAKKSARAASARKKAAGKATSRKRVASTSRAKKAPKPAAKKTPRPRKTTDTAKLEQALAGALLEIRSLKHDRDNQVAIAEAAEMEHSMILAQLEETQRKLQELEQQQAEQSMRLETEVHDPADEDDVDFVEDEEEHDTDDLDDVEGIYDRMDDPRVRRQELDRERMDRESEVADEPYWRICPKCGDTLDEVDAEDLKIDRCESCGGIYLDHGEVEMLLHLLRGPEGLHRVHSALRV